MSEKTTGFSTDKKIDLNITTPRGLKFEEKADMVIMRCVDGDLGVLYGHEPISTVLGDGILRIFNDGVEKKLAVFGGAVEIEKSIVNIFSTIAQLPEEIDLGRAEADRREVEVLLSEQSENIKIQSLQVLLRRSIVRIEVSLHIEDSVDFDDSDDGVDVS